MYRALTIINFTQRNNGRNLNFTANFVNEFSADSSWEDLTNKCRITMPKNVFVRDQYGNLFSLGGTNAENVINDLFQRGDMFTVRYGYYAYDFEGEERTELTEVFRGYISSVSSKIPITLECEDNMWLLKQIPCKAQTWPKTKTVEDLLKSLLKGTEFTVNGLTKTTVGDLIIQNESVAQLLARLRKEFRLESYFRGNELRIGSVVYIEREAVENLFVFQKNIISDDLTWQRKDDVKLSAVVNSINLKQGKVNRKGKTKTHRERLSVLVYADANGEFKYTVKQKNVAFPENTEGERRTLFYPDVTDAKTLAQYGIDELKKYYYEGFKGSFTTFAIPYVKMGDNVRIRDRVMPDRDGLYKVRSVKYTGGVNGQRQIIKLDYKIR